MCSSIDVEFLVALELATRSRHGHNASGRSARNFGRQIGAGNDFEPRGDSIKGNASRSLESLAENTDRVSDLPRGGNQTDEWFRTYIEAEECATASGAPNVVVSIENPICVLEESDFRIKTLGTVVSVERGERVRTFRADAEDDAGIHSYAIVRVNTVEVAVGRLHQPGCRNTSIGSPVHGVEDSKLAIRRDLEYHAIV